VEKVSENRPEIDVALGLIRTVVTPNGMCALWEQDPVFATKLSLAFEAARRILNNLTEEGSEIV
jgi:hypothetical protein